MSAQELRLHDPYDRKLFVSQWAGSMMIVPVVQQKGDAIALDRGQAHLLKLWLDDFLDGWDGKLK